MAWAWLAAAFAGAGCLSSLLCYAVMRLGVKDAPDGDRKIHKQPVPTSGGTGFAIATLCIASLVAWIAGFTVSAMLLVVLGAATLAAGLGFIDDCWPIPARVKLAAMLALAVGMTVVGVRADVLEPWPGIVFALPVALGVIGSLTWIIVVMNAVNFMDGANGLAMGMAAIAALGLAVCAAITGDWSIALAAITLAGALCGFLVWNAPGRLFAGDSGALFAGTALAGLSLLFVQKRPDLLFVPAILLAPFLTDVLMTIIWRAQRGKKLFAAHLDHAYQIAMKANISHAKIAGIHGLWAFNAAAVAVIATLAGSYTPTVAGIAMIAAGIWIHRIMRRFGVRAGLSEEQPVTRKP